MQRLLLLTVAALAFSAEAFAAEPLTPDRNLTPGAWNNPPTPLETLCAPGYPAAARHVSHSLKLLVFRIHGYDPASIERGDYEIDHLVPLELDGSNDAANLWPESTLAEPLNAHRKDVLENALKRLVCAGKLPLAEAQTAISTDWPAAYSKYVARR